MTSSGGRLEARVGAVRRHLRRRAALAAAAWVGSLVGFVLVLAWLLAGPAGWSPGSDVPLVLDVLAALGAGAVLLGMRRRIRRGFAEAPLTASMEEAAGLRPGWVRGALELNRGLPGGVSERLVEKATEDSLAALDRPLPVLAGRLGTRTDRWTVNGMRALAGSTVVLILLAVAAPERAGPAWGGLARPLAVMAQPPFAPLVVTPGTVEVPRGSDVDVAFLAPGRTEAQISWQAAGDVPATETVTLEDGRGARRFAALSTTVEYRVTTADGAVAGPFRLVPVDPMFVTDLTVEVAYPPHTGLPPEEYRGVVPPLRLPEGTRLLVEGRASRPLASADLLDERGTAVLALALDGPRFDGAWSPTTGGMHPWRFLDSEGAQAAVQPEPLELTLLRDAPPSVAIHLPGRDTILSLTLQQPLLIEAQDDYGLGRLELVAYRVRPLGGAEAPVTQGVELGGSRAIRVQPMLDLRSWGLLPGDEVRYFARVRDNAPAGQLSESPEYVLRMPSATAMQRDAERRLGDAAERLEALAEEADREALATRELQREADAARAGDPPPPGRPGAEEELGFEEKEELRKALEGQEALAGGVDSLRAELLDLQRAMEDAGQADPDLRKALEELQELLAQIAGEDLQERLEALTQEGEEGARQAEAAMRDLAAEQEAFRDRLEESLERFRRAAVEQDFRATQGEMDELARKEEALAAAMKEADDPALRADQQAALQREAEQVEERMETLQERLERLGEDAAAREVAQAREQAARGKESMGEARERAERGENQAAGEKAEEAAREMEKAGEQLGQAEEQMAEQQAEAALRALQEAADGALFLARSQEGLREAMGGASRERLAEMRAAEASLLQGVGNLAQNLHAAAPGAMTGNPAFSVQMGRAMASLERTMEALGNPRGPTPAPAAAAAASVNELNQLALMALAGAEQMSSQQGEGQSGEDTGEQLEQMAQQQGEVVNQASQLTPMQLGAQALQEQLERLAEEQGGVAEDLRELAQQEGAQEEALGDLQELAAEAQALAEELARGRLTPEVMQRQERLFHRLLDAGRSLQKEEEEPSDERESSGAGSFERGEVLRLAPGDLGALRYRMPTAAELQRLSPAVRRLVVDYFERLNRARGGGRP